MKVVKCEGSGVKMCLIEKLRVKKKGGKRESNENCVAISCELRQSFQEGRGGGSQDMGVSGKLTRPKSLRKLTRPRRLRKLNRTQ